MSAAESGLRRSATRVGAALTRYQLAARVVGVVLLVLVLIAMPVKYIGGNDTLVAVVGPIHGFLYLIYLLLALDLSFRCRWALPRTILVLLAGTVPFLTFIAERNVTRVVRGQLGR